MADGDRHLIAGWVIREDHRLPWNVGLTDPEAKLAVAGEVGHVRWLLFIAAQRELARRHLDTLVANRVGIEYGSTQRRRETPHDDHNESLWRQP